MARAPDPRIEQAKAMYLQGMKLVEIANRLSLPEGTVRRWKCTHKWENERSGISSDKKTNVRIRKRGGQPKNKNAVGNGGGAPEQNKNAEKYGFFSKYLPEETREIFSAIEQADPLDLLWHGMDGATVRVRAYGDNDTFGCWSDDTNIARFGY